MSNKIFKNELDETIEAVRREKEKDNKIEKERTSNYPEHQKISTFEDIQTCAIIFTTISISLLAFLKPFDDFFKLFLGLGISLIIILCILACRIDEIKFYEKQYEVILKIINGREFIAVDKITSYCDRSKSETILDLDYLIKHGYFKDAYLVEDDELLILNNDTYSQYKQSAYLRNNYNKKIEVLGNDRNTVVTCQTYLGKIRYNREFINNKDLKETVGSIEITIEEIVNYTKKHKGEKYILNKLENYYLPTTIKFIDAYVELDNITAKDKNIIDTMKELEEIIIKSEKAYQEMKLSLINDNNIDIKAEINTTKLLLERDGFLNDHIINNSNCK